MVAVGTGRPPRFAVFGALVATLLDAWVAYQRLSFPRLARKTRAEYTTAMGRALRELPAEPAAVDLHEWHAKMMRSGLSVAYANFHLRVLAVVGRAAAIALRDHELELAVRQVPPARVPLLAPRCPPRDLLDRVLAGTTNRGERCWFRLLALAGLRVGEMMGLRVEDWDPVTGVLRVVRQRENVHRKNRRPHSVRIEDAELRADLEWTIAHRADLKARTGWFQGRCELYLFPWGANAVAGLLRRARDRFGADRDAYLPRGLAWHAFRHWGATRLAEAGATPVEIQAWLGDASPDVAMRYVAHVRGETVASTSRLTGAAGSGTRPTHMSTLSTPHSTWSWTMIE